MRVLITGVGGFVGRHLVHHLLETTPGIEIFGTGIEPSSGALPINESQIDLRDRKAVEALIAEVQPEHVYHLAAQAFVLRSFEDPWETLDNNIRSQLNLTLACLTLPTKPRFLVVSSSEIYGHVPEDQLPATEDTPLRPANPYAVSKVAQDMLGLQYFLSHQLPVMRARPFNHIGPGQRPSFVAPDFATQIARIEIGAQEPRINVGDLSPRRDFTDVRDIVRAYRLIVEQGAPGEAYNIASGRAYSIQTLLDTLLTFSEVNIQVCVDPARLRPVEQPVIWGNASRLRQATGWQPAIVFEETLRDVLNDCRQRVRH